MKHYYYADNDQQFGPFTIAELKNKRLKKSTLVWAEGMQDWTSANDIEELKDFLISEPPPLPKKNNSLKPIESVQIKQAPKLKTSKKFDLSYEKETEATFVGILLLIIPIILRITGAITFETIESYNKGRAILAIISLILRIAITFWVVNIANRQNRNSTGWGWFAFFFPSIALIVIGLLKKLKLKIELDGRLTSNEQINILLEKANQLFSSKRYSECIEVLSKSIEIDNENFDCFKLRGLANYHIKNYQKAKADFEILMQSEKFLSIANFYLGNIALNNFNRGKAIEYWLEAKKHSNADADKKLDMYHNFTHKYLIGSNHMQSKLGLKNETPFIEYGITKYEGGLQIVDNKLKLKGKKVQINSFKNGLDIEYRKTWKAVHLAIAYYEIDNIVYKETEKIFELHLTDKNMLTFSYDQTKDYNKGLKKLCNRFNVTTGNSQDASVSWED